MNEIAPDEDEAPEPCPGAIDHVSRVLAGWRTRSNYERWGAVDATEARAWEGARRIVRALPNHSEAEDDPEPGRPVQRWAELVRAEATM